MLSRSSTLISTISNYLVLATLVLSVVLILPISDDFVTQTKMLIFFIGTFLLGVSFVIYSIQKKTIEFVLSPITIPLIVFGVAMAASTFFTNNYPVEALYRFGGAFLLMLGFVLFASTTTNKKLGDLLLPVAGVTSAVLTLFSITQIFKFGPANLLNTLTGLQIPTDLSFNVAVNSLFAFQFLVITAVGLAAYSVLKKNITQMTAVLFPIILCGIAVLGWSLLPGKPGAQVIPSWNSSWSVALDTIRSPRAALIGGGPASYNNLYTRFKPVWVNSTTQWEYSFNQASNMPLTLLTTTGFIGLITWLIVVFRVFKLSRTTRDPETKVIAIMLLTSIFFQLILPTHIIILIIQAVLFVALIASMHGSLPVMRFQALTMTMDTQDNPFNAPAKQVAFPIYFTAAIIIAILAASGYFVGRAYAASVAFFDSAKAAEAEDIVTAYEKQQQAVTLNPYLDSYRRQYAITNLTIASALAQKTDITEAEKEQVGQLLQQAVREARSAVLLDPLDAQNTIVLAQVYQNMIGAAEQAEEFALQAYVQSIENDPTNPGLRVSLGGLLLGQEKFSEAANVFNQAITIKRDFPLAYYNLAYTLVQLKDYENAKVAYQALLPLLDPTSEDYTKVTEELAEVEKMIAAMPKPPADEAGTGQPTGQGQATQTGGTTSPSLLDSSLENSNDVISNPSDAELTNPPPQPTETDLGQQNEANPPADTTTP